METLYTNNAGHHIGEPETSQWLSQWSIKSAMAIKEDPGEIITREH